SKPATCSTSGPTTSTTTGGGGGRCCRITSRSWDGEGPSGSQPIWPPRLHPPLDRVRLAQLAAEDRAAHLRELLVGAEAQRDQMRRPQLADAAAQLLG